MKTLKFDIGLCKGYNVMELAITTLFAVCAITKLLNLANDNTYRIKNNYLNWRLEKSRQVELVLNNVKQVKSN
ncbi:MAG: hypothetical protein KBD64_05420 [Gammaproteobacteria bacterium]|nr:hypothetical protein [Gammaproteobacteria bacterium]